MLQRLAGVLRRRNSSGVTPTVLAEHLADLLSGRLAHVPDLRSAKARDGRVAVQIGERRFLVTLTDVTDEQGDEEWWQDRAM